MAARRDLEDMTLLLLAYGADELIRVSGRRVGEEEVIGRMQEAVSVDREERERGCGRVAEVGEVRGRSMGDGRYPCDCPVDERPEPV